MNSLHELKGLRLHELLNSPQFLGILPEGANEDERLAFLFSETTRAQAWVTDDDETGYSVFVFDTKGVNKDKFLSVTNRDSRTVFLWAIDGKMFKKLSKCDCAIISGKKLHLVEFKANVESTNLHSIDGHYDKASKQLSLTLDYLIKAYSDLGADIFDIFADVDAKIVFDRLLPQDSAYLKNIKAKFIKANQVVLTFGNDITI